MSVLPAGGHDHEDVGGDDYGDGDDCVNTINMLIFALLMVMMDTW